MASAGQVPAGGTATEPPGTLRDALPLLSASARSCSIGDDTAPLMDVASEVGRLAVAGDVRSTPRQRMDVIQGRAHRIRPPQRLVDAITANATDPAIPREYCGTVYVLETNPTLRRTLPVLPEIPGTLVGIRGYRPVPLVIVRSAHTPRDWRLTTVRRLAHLAHWGRIPQWFIGSYIAALSPAGVVPGAVAASYRGPRTVLDCTVCPGVESPDWVILVGHPGCAPVVRFA